MTRHCDRCGSILLVNGTCTLCTQREAKRTQALAEFEGFWGAKKGIPLVDAFEPFARNVWLASRGLSPEERKPMKGLCKSCQKRLPMQDGLCKECHAHTQARAGL